MVRRLVSSRKGIGTVMGAVFFIALILASIITLLTIDAHQTRYLQAREEMVEWDIKRISENLNITGVNQPSTDSDYKFDIMVNNQGGVFTKAVRIYIYDSITEELWGIFDELVTGDYGFSGGEMNPGEGGHTIKVNASDTLESSPVYRYRIILTTERGRQFSCNYPKPVAECPCEGAGEGQGQPVPMIITWNQADFEYQKQDLLAWTPAWEIDNCYGSCSTNWALFRVNVTNIDPQGRDIELRPYSLIGAAVFGGEWSSKSYYIVNETSEPGNLVAFDKHTIPYGKWSYVYFATTDPGITQSQNMPPETHSYEVFVNLHFNFEGETDYYGLTISVMSMYVYTIPP